MIKLAGRKKKESKATAPSSALRSQSLAAVHCQNSSGDNLHSSPGWSQLLVRGGEWFRLETWPKHTTFETRAITDISPLKELKPFYGKLNYNKTKKTRASNADLLYNLSLAARSRHLPSSSQINIVRLVSVPTASLLFPPLEKTTTW